MNMNKKKLIPFGWLPAHWGTSGKTREIMRAEYELEGFELENRLLIIRRDEFDESQFTQKSLELQKKHNKITESQYHRGLVNLIKDEKQRALATLELDHREGKITQLEYEKQSATLKNEPWVNVINMNFGKNSSLEGSFELDWNEQFVDKLKLEGYNGHTSDAIVNQWFMEICRNVALEEFDGTGDFTADSEANLAAVKRWSHKPESIGEGRKGYK